MLGGTLLELIFRACLAISQKRAAVLRADRRVGAFVFLAFIVILLLLLVPAPFIDLGFRQLSQFRHSVNFLLGPILIVVKFVFEKSQLGVRLPSSLLDLIEGIIV